MKSGVRRIKGFKRHRGGEGAEQVQGFWEMPPMDDTVISLEKHTPEGWCVCVGGGGGFASWRFGSEGLEPGQETMVARQRERP